MVTPGATSTSSRTDEPHLPTRTRFSRQCKLSMPGGCEPFARPNTVLCAVPETCSPARENLDNDGYRDNWWLR